MYYTISSHFIIILFKKQSRFGSGVAVLDINVDGVLDLAVGAPAYWIDNPLEYKVGLGNNIK